MEVVRGDAGHGGLAAVNGDGLVSIVDLLDVLAAWGPCAGPCPADLDGSGDVGVTDLLLDLANWS